MTSPLANSAAALLTGLQRMAGETIRYLREGNEVELLALRGRSETDDYGSDGAALISRTVDWLISPDYLVLAGLSITPQHGDRIVVDNGDQFQVVHGPGESVWRWSDSSEQIMRIHSVKVASEVSP